MNGPLKNSLFLGAVVLLTILPLLMFSPSDSGINRATIFSGTDTQATGIIEKLSPDYRPWFQSLLKPPSSEIESLLFALQAALGAGIIGYYAGYVRGRKKALTPSERERRAH